MRASKRQVIFLSLAVLAALLLSAALLPRLRGDGGQPSALQTPAAATPPPVSAWQGKVLLSEIMDKNASVAADEDGDFSDWIEVYNASDESLDLAGWQIADRENRSGWVLPRLRLTSGERALIFASGKDRDGHELIRKTSLQGDPASGVDEHVASEHQTSQTRYHHKHRDKDTPILSGFLFRLFFFLVTDIPGLEGKVHVGSEKNQEYTTFQSVNRVTATNSKERVLHPRIRRESPRCLPSAYCWSSRRRCRHSSASIWASSGCARNGPANSIRCTAAMPAPLPIAMSAFPLSAPVRLTTSSGMEVPIPTIVIPIRNSLKPALRAIDEAPSTSHSAPRMTRARPPKRTKTSTSITRSIPV